MNKPSLKGKSITTTTSTTKTKKTANEEKRKVVVDARAEKRDNFTSVYLLLLVSFFFHFVYSRQRHSALWIYPIMPTNRVNKININVGEWTTTTTTEQKCKRRLSELVRERENAYTKWRRRRRSTIHRKSHWINNNGNNNTNVYLVEFQFSDLNDWSISTVICFLHPSSHHHRVSLHFFNLQILFLNIFFGIGLERSHERSGFYLERTQ